MAADLCVRFGAMTGRKSVWLSLVLSAACGHGPPGGPPGPAAAAGQPGDQARRARAAVALKCEPGGLLYEAPPASNDCCVAMTSVGDALVEAGQTQAAYDQYEKTRDECPRFHPVRRPLFTLRQAAPTHDPKLADAPMTDVRLDVDIDMQVDDDVVLAWFAPYLDGELMNTQPNATTRIRPGAHELAVEIYLRPRAHGALGGAVRMDVRNSMILARPLAGQKDVAGAVLVRLRDIGGGGTIGDRVKFETELWQFKPSAVESRDEVLLAAPVAGPLRLSDVSQSPHTPRLPPYLNLAGTKLWGLYFVCVDGNGAVSRVRTMKSALNPTIDVYWKTAVRTWRYRPYLVDGQPRAFCSVLRLEVSAH